jgi:hypothetical protein
VSSDPRAFAENYTPDQRDLIRFAWNGKHSQEFHDSNQEFRHAVAAVVIADPYCAPVNLIRDLLVEDGDWSHEAWCSPFHFADLATAFLRAGGPQVVSDFAVVINRTFDTFGAAHSIRLTLVEARTFEREAERLLQTESDERARACLESVKVLFAKITNGTAREGWATIPSGTPVRNIKVVHPSPTRRFLDRIRSWFG